MKRLVLGCFLFSIVLISCEKPPSLHHHTATLTEEPLEVSVNFSPQHVKAGSPVLVQLQLQHQGQLIEDADDIYVELWKDGAEENEKTYEVMYQGKGIYGTEITLEEKGLYRLMYHVTARGQHVMEELPLTVSEGE